MNAGGLIAHACALLAAVSAGCTRPPATPTGQPTTSAAVSTLRDWVVDPPLVDSERALPCPRLLSAAPNITEICGALGLTEHLVGRTRYCLYPPAIARVRSIGALNDLNVETLLQIRPELIIVSGASRAIADRLTRLGLRYEAVPDWTLADLFTAIERIGGLTGRPRTAARLIDGIRADLDTVTTRYHTMRPARVLLLTGPLAAPPTPPDAAGPGSFYDDLLRRVGHTNVVAAGGGAFAPVALEFVLRADPDVIIELAPDATQRPAGDADALRAWAQVGPLRAVATRRVHVLIGPQHFELGPRIAQTFEAICSIMANEQHESAAH
ncbi:MAG TPA: helical backbone metal receptor [Phycisphaerae bacterium]|nr:ABC transporter substrate-binding protein [Phycisphaerae bacterium]HPM22317.1 helical backbone metal receptor [Phycisphaerae bacterium]HQL53329.1 helical backbone metal receptor [Phycisphaerae bacterium]